MGAAGAGWNGGCLICGVRPGNGMATLLMAALITASGCASAAVRGEASAADRARWASRMGGVERCPIRESRMQAVCARLLDESDAEAASLRLRVLRDGPPRAYAFPPVTIYVTARAFTQLPADELAAAIAHELGHLYDDAEHTHAAPAALVTGAEGGALAIEMEADRLGVTRLRAAGMDPTALERLLQRIAAEPELSPTTRGHLQRRIAALGG